MHCENLCNINGIQITLFNQLEELNLSSNNIEDISELNALKRVRSLNLSCNKITTISGLNSMLPTLERLVLSHNRIANLGFFKQIKSGQEAPNFVHLDLADNYIGDLAQVQNLKAITSLRELIF